MTAAVGVEPAAADCLRPHVLQARAMARLNEELAAGGRGVVVMPCGSGKTLLGRWLAEELAARLTVVFVPTLALVPQTLLAYRSQTSWKHASMIVCSDPSSGRAVALDDLELPEWAREAVTSSTSTRAVNAFLSGPGPAARLIVSTYHSAPRVAAALKAADRVADLVVCDEAHRLTGRPRSEFRAVLDDQALPARRRVFLTATPVEAAAWAADNDDGDVVAPLSLDDEALFGPMIYRATFADAVTAGRLVDYDVHVLAVREARDDAPERAGAVEAVLTAAAEGATRLLTFHSRVGSARDLAATVDGHQLPDGRVVRAEHVEARHRALRRADALARLADPEPGTVAVLASARVLSEGVDVPAVDTVVFAEPRSSAVDIVQAVGRAMRLSPGKDRGRIVLAVTTDRTDLDEDTELSSNTWRHVWITLRALASMDPRFASQLRDRLKPGDSRRGVYDGPGLRLDLPPGLDVDRWMLRALDRTGGTWWHRYDLLAAHAREQGAARPGPELRRGGVGLGRWVISQRTLHRQGVLDPDRADALERLPGWAWDAWEVAWWRAAGLWAGRHTGRRVPAGDDRWMVLADAPAWGVEPPKQAYGALADFAIDTCLLRRRGELSPHLERAADQLPGWDWDVLDPDDARMVDALAEYAAWRQDLNAPHDYVHDDDLRLGAWLTAVRRRRYTGRLQAPLEVAIEMLGRPSALTALRWETWETAWRLGYLALRQYVTREGKCRIPYQHVEQLPDHELNLSRWCVVQRQEYRYGRLDADRVAALEAVPGWQWEVDLREGYRPTLGDAQHGTRSAYAKGCKCDPCTDANRAYEDARMVKGTDLVDAAPARGHLRMLLGRGAAQKELARAADLNTKTIVEVADGTVARIRPESHDAILALTLQAALEQRKPGRWDSVPGGPTWVLLDDMLERGWPKSWISRELGQGPALQLHRNLVSAENARKVRDLDDRLGRRRPPPRECRTPLPTLDQILAAERVDADERAS